MATFLALLNFTDQGIRSVKDTTRRAAAAAIWPSRSASK